MGFSEWKSVEEEGKVKQKMSSKCETNQSNQFTQVNLKT